MTIATTEGAVSLIDVKAHLRVDHDYEDDLITIYRDAAIDYLSKLMGRNIVLAEQVDHFTYRDLRTSSRVYFRKGDAANPVIEMFDGTNYTVVDASAYRVEELVNNPHFVLHQSPSWWYGEGNSVRVTYDAGIDVLPAGVKAAILLLTATLYEHREDTIVNMTATKMPVNIEYLIAPYRFLRHP